MRLYQYRRLTPDALEHLEALLRSGAIRFTPPSEFNDPFDCCPALMPEAAGEVPHAVLDNQNLSYQRATSAIHGVVCLTPNPTSLLMWSHYGDKHRGICVGFDGEVLTKSVPKNNRENPLYRGPLEVSYSTERPGDEGASMFLTKAMDWSYEREYRLVSMRCEGSPAWGPGVWDLPPGALNEIIVGARVGTEELAAIRTLAGARVAVKRVVPHGSQFRLVLESPDSAAAIAPLSGSLLVGGEWRPIPAPGEPPTRAGS